MRIIEPPRARYSALQRPSHGCTQQPTGAPDILVLRLLAKKFSGKVKLSWNMPGVFFSLTSFWFPVCSLAWACCYHCIMYIFTCRQASG